MIWIRVCQNGVWYNKRYSKLSYWNDSNDEKNIDSYKGMFFFINDFFTSAVLREHSGAWMIWCKENEAKVKKWYDSV